MPTGLLNDREELERLFDDLAGELARLESTAEVVMVGGAWMLWHARRSSTRDVDSARRFDTDIDEAIARVALRNDLSMRWLNDDAAPFWPVGARFEDAAVVYEHDALSVRAPAPEVVFVMKLYRADPQDREDLVALWTLCRFAGAAEAADAYRSAYPHAPDDPHLADYIAEVAADAA